MSVWNIIRSFQDDKTKESPNLVSNIAPNEVDRVTGRRDKTQQEVDELTLACQAMWELLSGHLGFTDDHLRAKILEIDIRDGSLDGKIGSEIVECPHCGQKVSTNKPNCVYCGNILPSKHVMK